jgi:hypothetical protein
MVDIASGTAFTPLEVEFRGDIHKVTLDREGNTEPSYAEFARQIAGLYELPSAWAVTSMKVGLSDSDAAAPAAPTGPAPADAPPDISSDADLLAVLSIADQRALAGDPPMRLKLERFGMGLTNSMAAFGIRPSGSLSDRARGVRIAKAKRDQQQQQGGAQAAAPFFDPRFQNGYGVYYANGGLNQITAAGLIKNMVNSAASNMGHWTSLKPGTDQWVDWQQEVKDLLTDTHITSLASKIKFIVPPRAPKADSSYVLLCSAGCFYYYPFTSSSGRKYAVIGRPTAMHDQTTEAKKATGVDGVMERQIPADLLAKLKFLGPTTSIPPQDEQAETALVEIAAPHEGATMSPEELAALRMKRQEEYRERQFSDFNRQFESRRTHDCYANLTRGTPMVVAQDLTILVTDDVHCLMASLRKLDKPANSKSIQEDLTSLLAEVMQATTFDVAATMQLETEQRRAAERQRALLDELEEESASSLGQKNTSPKNSPKKSTKKKRGKTKAPKPAFARALLRDDDRDAGSESSDSEPDSVSTVAGGVEEETYGASTAQAMEHGDNSDWTVVSSPKQKEQEKKQKEQEKPKDRYVADFLPTAPVGQHDAIYV